MSIIEKLKPEGTYKDRERKIRKSPKAKNGSASGFIGRVVTLATPPLHLIKGLPKLAKKGWKK